MTDKEAFKQLKNILFIDIETVSCCENYESLTERLKPLWLKKTSYFNQELQEEPESLFYTKAGIYAEFGKIVTIGIGFFSLDIDDKLCLRIKDFSSSDEVVLLTGFLKLIQEKFDQKKLCFCAHNGKEFDYPYLCRRLLVNGLPLPEPLALCSKKPWEIPHMDTMDMWKFGDRKAYTSLELLAALFGIKSSKDGIDGSMVNTIYYKENDLDKIAKYCKEDVAVTAQLYCKLKGLPSVMEQNIFYL